MYILQKVSRHVLYKRFHIKFSVIIVIQFSKKKFCAQMATKRKKSVDSAFLNVMPGCPCLLTFSFIYFVLVYGLVMVPGE